MITLPHQVGVPFLMVTSDKAWTRPICVTLYEENTTVSLSISKETALKMIGELNKAIGELP